MTLGGIIFIRNGELYDYSYKEAITCLQELCDKVVILDAGSYDGTAEIVRRYEDQNTIVVCLDKSDWEKQRGREKISFFQNLAASFLDTAYYFLLQGDEILHEDCFPAVREAIETGEEGIACSRINLWRDCNSYLSVPENRQPCSTKVIRIAKAGCQSVDDGESISANAISKFIPDIRIYHYGFVRKKEVMKSKIVNMQRDVFQIEPDPKLKMSEVFDWRLWFNDNDLSPLKEKHPKFISEWIISRP